MERIESIRPDRLRWCCDELGIAPEELAEVAGIGSSTLERVWESEGGLTFRQLQKLAKLFGKGVLFFLDPAPVRENLVHSPQFRTLSNQKPDLEPDTRALIDRAERQRDAYLGLLEDLGEEPQRFAPPTRDNTPLSSYAARIREWLELGESNNFGSYREAIEARGILVIRSSGYAGQWKLPATSTIMGFSLYHEVCPVIVVKKQDLSARQSFTLFHELGHLLLHRRSFIDDENDFAQGHGNNEIDANGFAGDLLVPTAFLERIPMRKKPNDLTGFTEWLRPFTSAWDVSTEMLLRRLMDAGLIEPTDYTAYREWRRENQEAVRRSQGGARWRYREPRHLFGEHYVRTVLDALNTRAITLNRASRYLDNLKVKDVHALKDYYAGS